MGAILYKDIGLYFCGKTYNGVGVAGTRGGLKMCPLVEVSLNKARVGESGVGTSLKPYSISAI